MGPETAIQRGSTELENRCKLTFLIIWLFQVVKVLGKSNHGEHFPLAPFCRSPVKRVVHREGLVRGKLENSNLGARKLFADEVEVLLAS